jgi:hypothetical protein
VLHPVALRAYLTVDSHRWEGACPWNSTVARYMQITHVFRPRHTRVVWLYGQSVGACGLSDSQEIRRYGSGRKFYSVIGLPSALGQASVHGGGLLLVRLSQPVIYGFPEHFHVCAVDFGLAFRQTRNVSQDAMTSKKRICERGRA